MIGLFTRKWKNRFLPLSLIVIGYLISIIAISVGISVFYYGRNEALDRNSGNPDHIAIVNINNINDNNFYINNLVPIINNEINNVESQVVLSTNIYMDNIPSMKAILVATKFIEKPEWQVPLVKGRHFSSEEIMNKNKIAIVGRELYNKMYENESKEPKSIYINGTRYNIVGVAGKNQKNTQWDNIIYIPVDSVPQNFKLSEDNGISIMLRKNGDSPLNEVNILASTLKDQIPTLNIHIDRPSVNSTEEKELWTNLKAILILGTIFLLITIINITNLSIFWIFDMRSEIAIRKCIGATNKQIIIMVSKEMLLISILSSVLAISIQFLVSISFNLMRGDNSYFQIRWINIIAAFLIAATAGLVTSIMPIKKALKMEPIDILNVKGEM